MLKSHCSFLSQPRWSNHPHIFSVRAWAGDLSSSRKTIDMTSNMEYLRGVTEKRGRNLRLKDTGTRIGGTELRLGPKQEG
jgi:hypothetical protein